ncbi:enoyl-CoA hydratase/carnithine racemase [Mycena belliarum]|uniref:Enoyl-CoA hydratase/carnithine racemase n=1 Tax=Mycena belliarum TaxID=1033014 RepID=A0AAD6UR44_9AGAR|nr:enoyl-CoA hydratase/carnithine racemase [Mycena belliae]
MPVSTNTPAPAVSEEVLISFPQPHVLLLTLNRPKSLNALTPQMADDMRRVLNWFEDEPAMWCVVVTGAGRAFCAGADLKAWDRDAQSGRPTEGDAILSNIHGFASISRRESKKPIIAAVNGGSYGGGTEMIMNCDLVVASKDATFALPEVKRGVIAIQGGIPRLVRIAGHQLASEMLLLGKAISADDARNRFGFVNAVVPAADVLPTALAFASQIVANSPDAVQSTKKGLLLTQRHSNEETVAVHVRSPETEATYMGENIKEGLRAFSEKRMPVWQNAGTRAAKL